MKHRLGIWISSLATIAVVLFVFISQLPAFQGDYAIRFNAYIVGLFVSIVSLAVVIVMTLRTRSRNSAIVWFVALAIVCILWTCANLMWAWSANPETAQYWQHILAVFWFSLPLVLTLFVVSYIDDNGIMSHPILWVSFPILGLLLIYVAGYSEIAYYREPLNTIYYYWGYESPVGDLSWVLYLWLGIIGTSVFLMLIQSYRQTKNRLKRKQLRIFIFAIGQFIIAGLLFDAVYFWLNTHGYTPFGLPPMSFAYSGAMAIIIGYGIIRYGIFKVNPAALSDTILENLSEAVIAVNNDMEIEFTNKGTVLITGFQEETLRGQHVSMLFDTEIFNAVKEKMRLNEAYAEMEDTRVKDSKGDSIPVTLSIGHVYDERNNQAGYVFVFANISELKRKTVELAHEKASVEQKVRERTQELSEERARLSASINSLKLGYIMTGMDHEILVMNASARTLLGQIAEELHKPIPTDWTLDQVQEIFAPGVSIMDSIKPAEHPIPFEFKEVQVANYFLYVFIAPVRENNEMIGSVILFEDVTDERALTRSKDEFFVIASHELRTPLTKIRGSAEIVSDVYRESITNDEAFKMLKEIETSSAHLIEIVNIIIEVSELEQGKITLRPDKIDLVPIVKEVLMDEQRKYGKTAIKTGIVCSMPEVQIVADKTRVKQLLAGFVSNAFKFTKDGSITVTLKPENNEIKVQISDTGKGVKTENRSLLFRKFQQAGSSLLSRDGEGTGLGLYVVKLLANIMGGTVGLDQSEEGKGSTFYFTLPIVQPPHIKQPENTLAKRPQSVNIPR